MGSGVGVLGTVVVHRRLDGVLGQDGAVDLDRRQRQLFGDLRVLDRQRLVQGLALDPLGHQRAGGDRRAAAIGLELGVLDLAGRRVDLDLQLHHIAAGRRADHAGADVLITVVELADVAGVLVVVNDLVAVGHVVLLVVASSVGGPLDGAEVDAVLVHIPQRGQFTQLGDPVRQHADGVIDLFLGREAADGHAQRAVRQLVRAAQRAQHIAGLQAGRGAGRAGRHRQALHAHDQRLAFHVVERDVEVVRHALLKIAVDEGLLDARQPLHEAVVQCADALAFRAHLLAGDAEGLTHADDLVHRQRAGAHTALVAAAVHLRFQAHARLATHVERANALGAVGLVRGQAHQIDGQMGQIDLDLAGGLGRVDVEDDAALAAQRAQRDDVLDDADLVVDVHDRGQDGVRAKRGLEGGQVDEAVRQHVEIGYVEALALQLAHRVQHGLVLGLDGDQVLAAGLVELGRALQREVVGLGGARGPDDLARVGADQLGHLGARLLDRLFRLPAPGVAARCRVAEMLAQPGNHRVHHAGVAGRRRAVVKVNREMRGHIHRRDSCYLLNAPPSAKTELGAVTRMGLSTGWLLMARLTGAASTSKPLASCSSASLRRDTESRYSIILAFRLVQSSWVMQRPLSSPMQLSLPPQPVASRASSTATMMSATVMSSALRPSEYPPPGPRVLSTSSWRRSLPNSCSK
mmetsp:Transcript_15032/g.35474  ORF Transcript_15032/g.35474 Transcript_15032/m.35474 type:complete len:690 (-) Transcript_15032:2922-4991(-)